MSNRRRKGDRGLTCVAGLTDFSAFRTATLTAMVFECSGSVLLLQHNSTVFWGWNTLWIVSSLGGGLVQLRKCSRRDRDLHRGPESHSLREEQDKGVGDNNPFLLPTPGYTLEHRI